MPYRVFADVVLIVHLAFVVFVVLGGLLALRWPRAAWLHVPAAAWGAFVEFTGRVCPLTPLENALRTRGGEAGYSGGFIDHYVVALLYPDGLSRGMQIAIGALVIALNVAVYGLLLRRLKRSRATQRSRS